MEQDRRLQIFVSSTYKDLEKERQAAVKAILETGHIPAGMELFAAGDQSQMDVIRTWIKQSDVFMLILGGRYGSIEPVSGKSYIQLEYEYALELRKPLFAVVISEDYLDRKIKEYGRAVIELDNPQKQREFRDMVLSRLVEICSDSKDIELAVHKSLGEFETRPELIGWRRADKIEEVRASVTALESKIKTLERERDLLLTKVDIPNLGVKLETAGVEEVAPDIMHEAFQLAFGNITHFGDTDVFPFPIENLVFFDRPAEAVRLLDEINKQPWEGFRKSLATFLHEEGLAPVGYSGFRWVTQMDPLWNAYLLSLVIALGDEIERARVPAAKNVVFSYRFKPDTHEQTLFDNNIGWPQFQNASFDLAEKYSHVLICDIADYYLHINHQHLHNSLRRVTSKGGIVNRIMELLGVLSKGVGYGLPVGGPAARLLSELLLNDVDRLLLSNQVKFHRFVDDYHIFSQSEEEARSYLAMLSELLLAKDSLPLQKAKTRILSAEEFRSLHDPGAAENEPEALERQVLRLRLHFDYYSETREEDYDALKEEMAKFPIEEMLARQMRKSRIDQAVTKKLIQMVRFQEAPVRNSTVASLLNSLTLLYPVFSTVMVLFKGIMPDLEEGIRQRAFQVMRELIAKQSSLVRPPINLAFAVRMLAHDNSEETVQVLSHLYRDTKNMVLKRDIILAMARNHVDFWTSALLRDFDRITPWERRALLIASYTLGDEGRDFRRSVNEHLLPMEKLVSSWAAHRVEQGQLEIPL